jgi:hypothetical protein
MEDSNNLIRNIFVAGVLLATITIFSIVMSNGIAVADVNKSIVVLSQNGYTVIDPSGTVITGTSPSTTISGIVTDNLTPDTDLIRGLGNSLHRFGDLYIKRIHLSSTDPYFTSSDCIDLQWLTPNGKPAIVWYDESGNRQAAIVAHDWANDMSYEHKHISIETSKPDGGLYTRFAIGWGADVIPIKINDSNVELVGGTTLTENCTVTQNSSTGTLIQSDSDAILTLNRATVSDINAIKFETGNALKWQLGTPSSSSENFTIKNQGKGKDAINIDTNNNIRLYAMDSDASNAATIVAQTTTGNEPTFTLTRPSMPIYSDNYSSSWSSFTPPTGWEGRFFTAHNTYSTGDTRFYSYVNGIWHYVQMQ